MESKTDLFVNSLHKSMLSQDLKMLLKNYFNIILTLENSKFYRVHDDQIPRPLFV